MSRWRWFWLAVITALSSAIAVRYVYKKRRATANTATVQAALLTYNNLKPGATRKEVKDYLRTHGAGFRERCCYEPGGPYSVLVQVGEEDSPWFCSAWPDYVAFEFSTTEAYDPLSNPSDSDLLKKVQLTSNGEGCLWR